MRGCGPPTAGNSIPFFVKTYTLIFINTLILTGHLQKLCSEP